MAITAWCGNPCFEIKIWELWGDQEGSRGGAAQSSKRPAKDATKTVAGLQIIVTVFNLGEGKREAKRGERGADEELGVKGLILPSRPRPRSWERKGVSGKAVFRSKVGIFGELGAGGKKGKGTDWVREVQKSA